MFDWLDETMNEVSYMYEEIQMIVTFARPVMIFTAIILTVLLFLVLSLHHKLNVTLKNHKVLQSEIVDVKNLLKGLNPEEGKNVATVSSTTSLEESYRNYVDKNDK